MFGRILARRNFIIMQSISNRQLFLSHVAQTSPAPIGLEIVRAQGIYQYDAQGRRWLDLIAGFSVCNIGHGNPHVIEAVKKQAEAYMHLIVYGEFIETPQVAYAKRLTDFLPPALNTLYFTNSGAEATEGAMKLAKRATGRSKIIAFNNSYHGSTQGALSLMGDEYWRNAFRPLLPDIHHFNYGSQEAVDTIDDNTACILLETVQAESGINKPPLGWLQAVRQKCTNTGALMILDEIQAGFGRAGTLWAFEQYGLVPDVLLLGKALGGGMPLGAFVAGHALMNLLTHNPVLGHITTFGGHPVSCAAGLAAFDVLLEGNYISSIAQKEQILNTCLVHPAIQQVRVAGLWAAVKLADFDTNKAVIHKCIERGLITDWFLFAPDCLRIAPPLIITEEELINACQVIVEVVEEVCGGGNK